MQSLTGSKRKKKKSLIDFLKNKVAMHQPSNTPLISFCQVSPKVETSFCVFNWIWLYLMRVNWEAHPKFTANSFIYWPNNIAILSHILFAHWLASKDAQEMISIKVVFEILVFVVFQSVFFIKILIF
jgi:hypothetical protein